MNNKAKMSIWAIGLISIIIGVIQEYDILFGWGVGVVFMLSLQGFDKPKKKETREDATKRIKED